MKVFDIPVSALRAAQQAMHTVSSNLANASTPGYHAQRAHFAETQPVIDGNFRIGAGVEISHIERLRSVWVEQSILRGASAGGEVAARLDAATQLDSMFTPSDSSIHARTQNFFDAWQDLASRPADLTLRRDLLNAASGLVDELNALHTNLGDLARDFDTQIQETVGKINDLSAKIAGYNRQIQIAEASGVEAHDLTDQRDQLVGELSQLIDVNSLERLGQPNAFSVANGSMTINTTAPKLTVDRSGGDYQLVIDGWPSPIPAAGGKLAGLLEARDSIIGAAQTELNEWGSALVRAIDQLHAQGLGTTGPFNVLTGERGLADASATLAESSQAFPIDAGELTVTMTDEATGARTVHVISIEPGLESLDDIAAKIGSIPHLTAQVSSASGRLTLVADQGYGFEFTGRTATEPDMSGWTGSSSISLGGTYTGTDNAEWTVSVLGSGTIGVTPDLRAEVRDGAGNIVGAFNIGLGYVAGDALETSQGITVQFGAGTVVGAEAADFRVTANPDETGFLSALGLNSMFTGDEAGGFEVRKALIDHPELLAAARSDQVGDNTNAKAAAALSLARLLSDGGMTFAEALAQMTANAGSLTQEAQFSADQIEQSQLKLTEQQQAISGVDPNAELVKLLEYQRLFQSSARFISTVNEALDDLFNVIG